MTEPRDVRLWLDDVLENLQLAREFTEGLSSAAELAANRKTMYAVVRALEIVGEAAKKVPQAVRDQAPEVPWSAMAGMRDRLIHGYREVDVNLVWRTATAATRHNVPEENQELQVRLEQLAEAEREMDRRDEQARNLRDAEIEAIESSLAGMEALVGQYLAKHSGEGVSLEGADLRKRLEECSQAYARGEKTPALFKRAAEEDPETFGDYLSYALLLTRFRTDLEQGLAFATTASNYLADTRAQSLQVARWRAEGRADEAEAHHEQVMGRLHRSASDFDRALPDLLQGFRVALGLLSSLKPEHVLFGAKTLPGLRTYGKKAYRAAATELFRRILDMEGPVPPRDVWKWAGTSDFRIVTVDGTVYTFRKCDGQLEIKRRNVDGTEEGIHSQSYNNTVRDWVKEAKALPKSSSRPK